MLAARELVLHNGARGDLSSAPSIHSGTGAPTDADDRANGTLYLRRNPAGAGSVLYVKASGAYSTVPTVAGTDFGGGGILADVVGESGAGVGVTVDGVLLKDGDVLITDANVIKFGTPGTDVVMTADGTDLVLTGTGDVVVADSLELVIGTGKDLRFIHDGSNTTITSTTGNLIVDNTAATGATYFDLGTDTSATSWAVRNNSGSALLSVNGAGALAASGQVDLAGNLDATGGIDIDADSVPLTLGASQDDSVLHNGTNTIWTHATGNLILDNTAATGATYVDLGTDTSATSFAVRNNSGTALFTVTADSVVTVAATLKSDVLAEKTGAAGVTIDGLLLKDSGIDASALLTGVGYVGLADNLASAWVFKEAANAYLTFVTTNSSESVKLGKPLSVTAGMSAFLDLSAAATGEADAILGDNLAVAFEIREAANSYITVATTNDAERVRVHKILAEVATTGMIATPIDMAGAEHTLVLGTAAGAAQTKLLGNVVFVDANTGSAPENLVLPSAASLPGVTLRIINVGGEQVTVNTSVLTLETTEGGFVTSDGTSWYGYGVGGAT
jgi:hypothetical protein